MWHEAGLAPFGCGVRVAGVVDFPDFVTFSATKYRMLKINELAIKMGGAG